MKSIVIQPMYVVKTNGLSHPLSYYSLESASCAFVGSNLAITRDAHRISCANLLRHITAETLLKLEILLGTYATVFMVDGHEVGRVVTPS